MTSIVFIFSKKAPRWNLSRTFTGATGSFGMNVLPPPYWTPDPHTGRQWGIHAPFLAMGGSKPRSLGFIRAPASCPPARPQQRSCYCWSRILATAGQWVLSEKWHFEVISTKQLELGLFENILSLKKEKTAKSSLNISKTLLRYKIRYYTAST